MTDKLAKDPFTKVEPTKLDLKLGIFGTYKVGKTVLALSAANDEFGKVAVVDPEGGTKPYIGIYDFNILPSKSYMELINALNFLDTQEHDYKTLVIDPATMTWDAIKEARARLKKSYGVEGKFADFHGLDWVDMKGTYKSIMARIVNLNMNVIMVFREKDEVIYKGGEGTKTGQVILEGEKSSPYDLDVYGRLTKNKDGNRVFEVRGTRYDELEDKKIKLPKFTQASDNHGFKKIYDLCGLSKRNQMAEGSVKYDVESADKDFAALNTGQDKRELSKVAPANDVPSRDMLKADLAARFSKDVIKGMWGTYKKMTDASEDKPNKLNDVDYTAFVKWCVDNSKENK